MTELILFSEKLSSGALLSKEPWFSDKDIWISSDKVE